MKRLGLLRIPIYLLYVALILDLGCRAYWRIDYGIPLLGSTRAQWHGIFFKGFLPGAEPPPGEEPQTLDVLLLGGSVLYGLYKHNREEFTARFEAATGRPVRLVNHAKSGHTSRDSLLKYRLLADRDFDLVIFYHGINDVRLNEVTRGGFRSDYTHYTWYEQIADLDRHRPWEALSLLPYTLAYAWLEWFGGGESRGTWSEVRTGETFRANLAEILELAAARGEPVLLMTFAWHVPEDYTLERFERGELDYGGHNAPIEIWGDPEAVVGALRVHNRVIAGFRDAPGVIFVDAASALPRDAGTFDDICHFSKAGESRWMDLFLPAVAAQLPSPAP